MATPPKKLDPLPRPILATTNDAMADDTMLRHHSHPLLSELLNDESYEDIIAEMISDEREALTSMEEAESPEARYVNVIMHHVLQAGHLLDLAASVTTGSNEHEAQLATHPDYQAAEEKVAHLVEDIKAASLASSRTGNAIDRLLSQYKRPAVGDRGVPNAPPAHSTPDIPAMFATLDNQLDAMGKVIDIELGAHRISPEISSLSNECWTLAHEYMVDAKLHAQDWKQQLERDQGQSKGGGVGGRG